MEVKLVALLTILAPLFAACVPWRGYSFFAAAFIAFAGSLFMVWQSMVEPDYTLDLYTWLASETRRWTFSLAIEAQRIALLSLLNSVALILAIYALGFRREIAVRDFSTAAIVLFALQLAGLAASDIAFFLAWGALAYAALWCGTQKDGWGGVRPLDRLGDVLMVAGAIGSLVDLALGAAYCIFFAIATRVGCLPFPLEVYSADRGRCRGWFFALLGDLVSPFLALVLFWRYRAFITTQIAVLDLFFYVGLATALAAVLAALKVEDVRRSFSMTSAGHMGIVLAFIGMGAEVAAIFLFALHGVAKTLARVAADGLALAAGGEWRRQELGLLRRQLPLFSAAFCLASILLALGPGLAVLWVGDGGRDSWVLAVSGALAFLYSLQAGAVLVRVFSLPRPEQARAFPAPQQASYAALIGLAALAGVAVVALPNSPLLWMKTVGAESAALLTPVAFAPLAAGFFALLFSWLVFGKAKKGESAAKPSSWEQCLAQGYYLRDVYLLVAAKPLWAVVRRLHAVNSTLIEVAINEGVGLVLRSTGWVLALAHNGRVRSYGVVALVGIVALLWGMVKE